MTATLTMATSTFRASDVGRLLSFGPPRPRWRWWKVGINETGRMLVNRPRGARIVAVTAGTSVTIRRG